MMGATGRYVYLVFVACLCWVQEAEWTSDFRVDKLQGVIVAKGLPVVCKLSIAICLHRRHLFGVIHTHKL